MDRPYLLEQIDEAAVVQLYADGFEALPLDQKILIWHLSQAALAGRDIYYDQRYRHNLEMRAVLEGIVRAANQDALGATPREVVDEIRRYTKLFWINSGPYNNLTARKFVLKCSFEDLLAAAAEARKAGTITLDADALSDTLTRLRPAFFDASFEPLVTNKTPGDGRDILEDSANNLYQGVTMADLAGMDERYGLNSRVVKTGDGRLAEEIYRVGGKYGVQIEAICTHLTAALPFATPAMRKALEALITFYHSGEDADRVAYDIAWVEDKDSPVDTINGFIENYMDARGVKGAW